MSSSALGTASGTGPRRRRPDVADGNRDRPGDRLRLRDQVRLPCPGGLLLQVAARALARADRRDLVAQERAGLDAEAPAPGARVLPRPAAAALGRRPGRDRLR